jgi:hypothetical protein
VICIFAMCCLAGLSILVSLCILAVCLVLASVLFGSCSCDQPTCSQVCNVCQYICYFYGHYTLLIFVCCAGYMLLRYTRLRLGALGRVCYIHNVCELRLRALDKVGCVHCVC